MTKPVITNLDELKAEKERIKADIKYRKSNIGASFKDVKREMNPFAGISESAKNILTPKASSPLVSFGIATAADLLLKKVVLKRSGFLTRLIVPFVVKKAADYVSAPKLNAQITSRLHHTAESLRDIDVEDVANTITKPVNLLTAKVSGKTADVGNKIADSLHSAAGKVREEKEINIVPEKVSEAVSNAGNKVAVGMRDIADKLRSDKPKTVHSKKRYRYNRQNIYVSDVKSDSKIAEGLRSFADALRRNNYKIID